MAGTKVLMWYDGAAYQLFGSQRTSDSNNTYSALDQWVNVTGTSQTATINRGYLANNAAEVTVTLPTTAAAGSIIDVFGIGAGGFKITVPSGDNIILDGVALATSTGYVSGPQYGYVSLRCAVANTTWVVISYVGAILPDSGLPTGLSKIVWQEIPSGSVNSSNKVYTTAYSYVSGTICLYINGLMQSLPSGHFAETSPSAGTITTDEAPLTGDIVLVSYVRAA